MTGKATILIAKLWVVALLAGPAALAADGQEVPLLQPQALKWAGVHALQQVDPGLTGAGVRIGVICRSATYSSDGRPQNDYQPNAGHACFQTAKLHFLDERMLPAGVSSHSTAICSILFGRDPQAVASDLAPFLYQGVVPEAEGRIYESWHFLAQYVHTQTLPEVDVASASFGQPFEDWWTRGIEALIEQQGLVFFASIGNGTNACDPPFYPGAGPNAIGVGVVSSVNAGDPAVKLAYFALAYPEESSVGPTVDGRCKPDIIAPGNCLVAQTDSEQGYVIGGNWSSFSTPMVAGVAGLLVQAARQDPNLAPAVSPKGGNLALKAILMSSATKLPYWHKGRLSTEDDHDAPLDYAQGAGMVHGLHAYQLLKAGRGAPGDVPPAGWDLNQVGAGQNFQQAYRMTVDEPGDKVLTATLVWNRHYSSEYPFKRIADSDSDLRLELWAVDPANSANDLLLDYSDSRVDNVEHLYVPVVPGYTVYELVVSYNNPEGKPTAVAGEPYAVAWSLGAKGPQENIGWHDLNADGVVNEHDFTILMNNWVLGLKSPEAYVIGDLNGDGTIDADDMQAIFEHLNDKADWHVDSATAGQPMPL